MGNRDGVFGFWPTNPVHKANISQHEEVDLDKQPSLGSSFRRHAPNGDPKAMQEAHVKRARRLCRYVTSMFCCLPQGRASCAYNMNTLYPRLCICSAYRTAKTLGPMLPWCSVIVAAVAFLAEVDDHRVLRAGRDQPRTELIGTA